MRDETPIPTIASATKMTASRTSVMMAPRRFDRPVDDADWRPVIRD